MNSFISINTNRCIGCGTCQAACSAGHASVGEQAEPRLSVVFTKDVTASITCHHCEGAPCLAVCPVNAITHEGDRIVVNEQTCIGCKLCACVCPFGAIHPSGTSIAGVAGICQNTSNMPLATSSMLKWEIGVPTVAVKCDLCAYDKERGPHCVAVCPTKALELVTEFSGEAEKKQKRKKEAKAAEVMNYTRSTVKRYESTLTRVRENSEDYI